jgi:hypothetical protein
MGARGQGEALLYATLCEIEYGLFYAAYHIQGHALNLHRLPAYQVGVSADEAKSHMVEALRELGIHTVIWRDGLVVPPHT